MAIQDIQDSNPYSRNLILISFAIIIFILADGILVGESLKIHVVNIEFKNIEVFEYFVLILYVWFNFRYWQTEKVTIESIFLKSKINPDKTKEIKSKYTKCFLSKLFLKTKNLNPNDNFWIQYTGTRWEMMYHSSGRILETRLDKLYLAYFKMKFILIDTRIFGKWIPYIISLFALLLLIDVYFLQEK